MRRNELRNCCERLRCKKTSHQIRKIRKSDPMIVTTANNPFDQQSADSHDAEKNNLSDVRRDDDARGNKRQQGQPRRDKRDVHGWIVLDKPIGMTSTHAVAVVKRLFQAKRAGHAGTLDPLPSGGLPIALRQATKTVPSTMATPKPHPLTPPSGAERDTADTEGRFVKP